MIIFTKVYAIVLEDPLAIMFFNQKKFFEQRQKKLYFLVKKISTLVNVHVLVCRRSRVQIPNRLNVTSIANSLPPLHRTLFNLIPVRVSSSRFIDLG